MPFGGVILQRFYKTWFDTHCVCDKKLEISMKQKIILAAALLLSAISVSAQRLTIGGYGEAMYTRNFYSDAWQRYITPEKYADDKSHGRFDIPHFVISLGYDFGKGWSLGTEIEFEHGGTESAVELEADETGEYESEIERGGEVALEQAWIQKVIHPAFNVRAGMIIVPVGLTNSHHLPNEFFTGYRQEGENTIFPCTWHEVGLELWGELGRNKTWKYELLFLPGLDSDRFSTENFIQGGAGSPYEFKIANSYAGAFRIDNRSVKGLRLGLSGYVGGSFSNSLTKNKKYEGLKGEVFIGSVDFDYKGYGVIARGVFDYAHLNNSAEITAFNKNNMSAASPSPRNAVGSDAIVGSFEIGYDFLHPLRKVDDKCYVFAHYEYYDAMFKVAPGITDYPWVGKHRIAVGFNWYPINEIIVKAEYSHRFYEKPFNNEPSVTFGIAFAGWFENTFHKKHNDK